MISRKPRPESRPPTSLSLEYGEFVRQMHGRRSAADSQSADELEDASEDELETEENLEKSSFDTVLGEERIEMRLLGLHVVQGLGHILRKRR